MLPVTRKPNLKPDTVVNPVPIGFLKLSTKENCTTEMKTDHQKFQGQREDKRTVPTNETIMNSKHTSQQISPKQNIEKIVLKPKNNQTTEHTPFRLSKSSKNLSYEGPFAKRFQRYPLKQYNANGSVATERQMRHSIDEFINSQKAHSRKSAERLQNIKKQIDKKAKSDLTFKPKISNYPVTTKGKVHERLYSKGLQSKFKNQVHFRHIQLKKQSYELFPSNEDFFEYSETNPVKSSRPFTARTQSRSQLFVGEREVQRNSKLLIRKICKQISESCQRLGLVDSTISQADFCSILIEMNFSGDDAAAKFIELWSLFGQQSMSLRKMAQVVCSLFGLHDTVQVQSIIDENPIFVPLQGEEKYSEQFSKMLKSKFDGLYLGRLNRDRLSKASRELINYLSEKDLTFKPEISKKSRQLAQKYRQKKRSGPFSKFSLLKNSEGETHLLKAQPHLGSGDILQQSSRQKDSSGYTSHRFERNTHNHQLNSNTRKSDVGLPNTERPKLKRNCKPFAGNIEKQVARLIYARKKRNGAPIPQQPKKKCCGFENQTVLKLDIYIDQKQKHELVVHNEDEPEQVARRFSSQFHISKPARDRLSELIISEIHKATC